MLYFMRTAPGFTACYRSPSCKKHGSWRNSVLSSHWSGTCALRNAHCAGAADACVLSLILIAEVPVRAQFETANSLVVRAVLPLLALDSLDVSTWPQYVLPSEAPLSGVQEGIVIRVVAMGPACSNILPMSFSTMVRASVLKTLLLVHTCVIISQGISGDTFRQTTIPQPSARYTHVFSCPHCVLSSLSAVNLAFNRLCQHIAIDVACVDAEGNAYLASHVGSSSSPLLRDVVNTSPLSSVTLRIPLSLSAQNNELTNVKQRGVVMLSADVVVNEIHAASRSVNVTIEVCRDSVFVPPDIFPMCHCHRNAASSF